MKSIWLLHVRLRLWRPSNPAHSPCAGRLPGRRKGRGRANRRRFDRLRVAHRFTRSRVLRSRSAGHSLTRAGPSFSRQRMGTGNCGSVQRRGNHPIGGRNFHFAVSRSVRPAYQPPNAAHLIAFATDRDPERLRAKGLEP